MIHYRQKLFSYYLIMTALFMQFNPIAAVLTMSQYKPDSSFEKPYFTQDYFMRVDGNFSGGFAHHAYNQNNESVQFMQQFGTEDLLNSFVDPNIATQDVMSMGQGLLSGKLNVQELILSCYKNMNHGFFLQAATVIQNVTVNDISVAYVTPPTTAEQETYLTQLQQLLPSMLNRTGMFTTAIYGGFHTTFNHFTHLDFIDLQIKLGFMAPQAMLNSNSPLVEMPFLGNFNFGYPIITTTSLGVLDWLTVGLSAAIIPWQNSQTTLAVHTNDFDNTLLLPTQAIVTVAKNPLFTSALYLEGDHFYQGLSTTLGYCFTCNGSTTLTPHNPVQFSSELMNESELLAAWNMGSIYVQFDVDFANHLNPNAPIVIFYCNLPVNGHLTAETSIFGNCYAFQISYAF